MKIVGITSCSTGIAHTYMAAESLEIAAKKRDIEIKVETQGSIGAENVLTEQEIADADAVIIAASTSVNKDRFNGKRLLEVDVTEAIDHPDDLFDRVPNAAIYTTSGEVKTEAKAEKKRNLQSFDDRCVLHDPLCCGRWYLYCFSLCFWWNQCQRRSGCSNQ